MRGIDIEGIFYTKGYQQFNIYVLSQNLHYRGSSAQENNCCTRQVRFVGFICIPDFPIAVQVDFSGPPIVPAGKTDLIPLFKVKALNNFVCE